MKLGFVVWNTFQIKHFKKIMGYFEDKTLIIYRRKQNTAMFNCQSINELKCNTLFIDAFELKNLDKIFDVLFCQTVFPGIEKFINAKIVMLQYGLAKEPHNYGQWRALADLIFCYGTYSFTRLNVYSPTICIGHPSIELEYLRSHEEISTELGLDKLKKTILYCPTWGELSSIKVFSKSIKNLTSDFNVLIKLHHNSLVFDFSYGFSYEKCLNVSNKNFFEMIKISDIVISDYSGAIFDAMYLDKKIILCQHLNLDEINCIKLDHNSIEYKYSDKIGLVVKEPKQLLDKVRESLTSKNVAQDIKKDLFEILSESEFKYLIINNLKDLLAGKIAKNQVQQKLADNIRKNM